MCLCCYRLKAPKYRGVPYPFASAISPRIALSLSSSLPQKPSVYYADSLGRPRSQSIRPSAPGTISSPCNNSYFQFGTWSSINWNFNCYSLLAVSASATLAGSTPHHLLLQYPSYTYLSTCMQAMQQQDTHLGSLSPTHTHKTCIIYGSIQPA